MVKTGESITEITVCKLPCLAFKYHFVIQFFEKKSTSYCIILSMLIQFSFVQSCATEKRGSLTFVKDVLK